MQIVINLYYQLLTLGLLSFFLDNLHRLKSIRPRLNFFILCFIGLPIMLAFYLKNNWWLMGYCGLMLLIGFGYYMLAAHKNLKLLNIVIFGLLLAALSNSYLFNLEPLETNEKVGFYYYLALMVIYFYKQSTKERFTKPAYNNFKLKPVLAVCLLAVSLATLSAQLLGFFGETVFIKHHSVLDLVNFIFLISISVQALVKIGFYNIADVFLLDHPLIKIFAGAVLTGLAHWTITANKQYLLLGTLIGMFTGVMYFLGGFWSAVVLRLLITLVPFLTLGVAI